MEQWIKELEVGSKDVFVESSNSTCIAWYNREKGNKDCSIAIHSMWPPGTNDNYYKIMVSKNNTEISRWFSNIAKAQSILDTLINTCEQLDILLD